MISVENKQIAAWVGRESGDRAGSLPAIRRQHRRRRRQRQGENTLLPIAVAAVRPGRGPQRSVDLDPPIDRRRAIHPRAIGPARGHRDLRLPQVRVGDAHSRARAAGVADRRLRVHVRLQLFHRQHLAAGDHALGRFRRRRRDRHAGEHHPPYRKRHEAVRRRAERLERDRLHDSVHHLLAGGGVHPGVADERRRRTRLPRIRGHNHGRDSRLGLRLADTDPNALRAHPERAQAWRGGRLVLPSFGHVRRRPRDRLSRVARFRAAIPPLVLFGTFLTAYVAFSLYAGIPKGFFPEEDTGFLRGITEAQPDTSFREMSARQITVSQAHRGRPGGRIGDVGGRIRRRDEQRLPVHPNEGQGAARLDGDDHVALARARPRSFPASERF